MLKRIFVLSILCLARRCQAVPEGSGLDQGATEDFSFGQAAANCSSSGGFLCGDLCTATFCRCGDATLTLDSDSRCCVEEGAYCSRGDTGDVVCATGYSASKTESCSPDTEGDRLHQSVLAMSKLMYNMFANKSRDNFVFSPLSVHNVLAVLYTAATDNSRTKTQLQQFLRLGSPRLGGSKWWLEAAYSGLTQHYDSVRPLTVANSLWLQHGLGLQPQFNTSALINFGLVSRHVDFSAENSSAVVNEWISEKTGGLIPKLVTQFAEDTQIFLANALHFNDRWLLPFQDETEEGDSLEETDFFLGDDRNTTIKVPMMLTVNEHIHVTRISHDQDIVILKIPYINKNFQMKIIFPENLTQLEASLSDEEAEEDIFRESWTAEEVLIDDVRLIMPKFKISTRTELSHLLQVNNVTQLFNGAELSKMVQSSADEDGAGLGLSKIVQRSAVTVDKEGTEGASATGAELVLLAGAFGDNVDLVLDRPFLFLVEDVVHRIPVLVGRVMNPLL